jgi:hypothetical protein
MPDIVAAATLSQGGWDAKVRPAAALYGAFRRQGNVTSIDATPLATVSFDGAFGKFVMRWWQHEWRQQLSARDLPHFFTSPVDGWSFGYLMERRSAAGRLRNGWVPVPVSRPDPGPVRGANGATGVWTGKVGQGSF